MRTCVILNSIVMLWCSAPSSVAETSTSKPEVKVNASSASAILREASEILLRQPMHQGFWSDRLLLEIADIQIRARDFVGARQSIRGSRYDYGRSAALVDLAERLAGDGKWQDALDVLREMGDDHGWRQDYLEDGVRLQWIDHLIEVGDLEGASAATELLTSDRYRPDGLRSIAVAHHAAGDETKALRLFGLAINAADKTEDDFDRFRALWEIADDQLAAGANAEAKKLLSRLADDAESGEPWASVSAYCKCARLIAKTNDRNAAEVLFERAIDAQKRVGARNTCGAIVIIAKAQAEAGYFDDAIKTALKIEHNANDMSQDGRREEALCAIAMAQTDASDIEAAIRSAERIQQYVQYRDDALHAIVVHQIRKQNLTGALGTADKLGNSSREAAAKLTIAAAYAKSGDAATARAIAERIQLLGTHMISGPGNAKLFDYRSPSTWGFCYDGPVFNNASRRSSHERAAEVAAAAMICHHSIDPKAKIRWEEVFADVEPEQVIRALARAHAISGDATEALEWSQNIGSEDRIDAAENFAGVRAVQQRIYALVGVAEGILARLSDGPLQPQR